MTLLRFTLRICEKEMDPQGYFEGAPAASIFMEKRGDMFVVLKRTVYYNVIVCLALTMLLSIIIDNSKEFYVDDYQSFFLPGYMDIGKSLDAGEYPLLSPYSWAGGALAAGYPYGVFNIPQLIVVYGLYKINLDPIQFARYYTLIYFFILCLGISVLSECYELSFQSKVLAISIGAMNYFVLHWSGFDWVAGLASFAWLPWCWATLQRIVSERKIRWIASGSIFVYLVLTAGYPFTVGMMVLLTLWICFRCLWRREHMAGVARMLLAWGLGLGLSMPALLMFVEYFLHSAKIGAAEGLSSIWSVPPDSFWGMLNPLHLSVWNMWGVLRMHYSFELFCGIVPPVALLVLALHPTLKKKVQLGFELLLLAVVVFIMVAPSGVASYRWSFRWLPLCFLLLAIISAKTSDYVDAALKNSYTVMLFGFRVSAVMLCAFVSAALFLHQYVSVDNGKITEVNGYYAVGVMFSFFLWAYFLKRKKKYKRIVKFIPAVLTIASLGLISVLQLDSKILAKWRLLDTLHANVLPFDTNARYMSLFSQNDFYRQASAATIMPGNTPMLAQVHCVTGYSPMMLTTFSQLFGFEYSSSMKQAELDATCKNAFATGGMFDLLGIDGVVFGLSQRERAGQAARQGWNIVSEGPGGVILHRARRNAMHIESALLATYEKSEADVVRALREKSDSARRHVLLDADGGQPSREAAFAPVSIEHPVLKRNSLAADIANASQETPGLIIFKRAWYPGYRVFLNDRELPVVHADMLLPAVVIPPGQSGRLLLDYAPASLRIGLLVAGCSLLLLLGVVVYGMKGRAARTA